MVGRGALVTVEIVAVFMLLLGTLTSCGSENEGDVQIAPEEAGEVVVRVSGTEGTAYSGTYGNVAGEPQSVDDTLRDEPIDYEVEVQKGVSDGVFAGFRKAQPGGRELEVAILADDEIVVESTTHAALGSSTVEWLPQVEPPPEEGLPEERPPEEPS